jgi:hypothetical protein
MKIKPRFLPRDLLDILIGLPVGALQVGVLLILPSVLAALLLNPLVGVLTYPVIYTVWLLFSVRSITVDVNGIAFHRVFGSPKHLRREEIVSVEEAPRREVVLCGWLWPLFPAREMTPSLSALHHFRIRWAGGYCYFPPKDVAAFPTLITEMMKGRPNQVPEDTARKLADPQH